MKILSGRSDEFDRVCVHWERSQEGTDAVSLAKMFTSRVEGPAYGFDMQETWQLFLQDNAKKITSTILKKILYLVAGYWAESDIFVQRLPQESRILLAEEYFEMMGAFQEAAQKGFENS